MVALGLPTYEAFMALHGVALSTSLVPMCYWPSLWHKLEEEVGHAKGGPKAAGVLPSSGCGLPRASQGKGCLGWLQPPPPPALPWREEGGGPRTPVGWLLERHGWPSVGCRAFPASGSSLCRRPGGQGRLGQGRGQQVTFSLPQGLLAADRQAEEGRGAVALESEQ